MIWFIIWLAFVLFIVWLFARSLRTVMRQQKAWGQFARKHNLLYQKAAWYRPPSLEGQIQGRRVRIYVEEFLDPVRRLREFRTTIEIYFRNGFPTGLAIGSRAYHSMLRNIDNVEEVTLPIEPELLGLLALTREPLVFNGYMNAHMIALKEFFGNKMGERLLMGHETDGFLVTQSGESLDDVKILNARMKDLFALMDRLEPEQIVLPAPIIEQAPEAVDEIVAAPEETEVKIENETQEETKEL